MIDHADAGQRQAVTRHFHHGRKVREAVVVLPKRHALAGLARAETTVDLDVEAAIAPVAELARGEGEGITAMRDPGQGKGDLGRSPRRLKADERAGDSGGDKSTAGKMHAHEVSRVDRGDRFPVLVRPTRGHVASQARFVPHS